MLGDDSLECHFRIDSGLLYDIRGEVAMIIKHLEIYYPKNCSAELLRIANALENISNQLEKNKSICNVEQQNNSDSISISDSEPESMTVTEAAKLLRISNPKMYELLQTGKIHSIRVGRKILISRSSLLAFLAKGQ